MRALARKEWRLRFPARYLVLAAFAFGIPSCGKSEKTKDVPAVTTAFPTGGTFTGSPTVMLTADDPIIAFGLNYPPTIYYSTDGADPSIGGANTISGPSPLGGITFPLGTTTLKFFSVDGAGNIETLKSEGYIVN